MNAPTDTGPLAPIKSPGGARLRIVIDDDGPGIEPDRRGTVTARGARLDESAPGNGLGMAIVYELVGLYGGRVQLDTAPMGE
jgi:signal transduction histidine kinase